MRRKSPWLIAITGGLLALTLWFTGLAAAQGPTLSVDATDTPLVINGTRDEQTTAFSGNIRLTAIGGDVSELRLLSSDLQLTTDANVVIDRSNVTIPAGTSLSNGQPRDVRVTVNNVTRPGDYTGELKFLLPGQAEAQALIIPLELHIDAQPNIVPVTANLSFQVVRCQNPLDCALATWLLPDSVVREDWVVQLDNQTLLPVEVTDGVVVMRGDKTGNAVRASEIELGVPHTLPASQVEPVGLTIRRNQLYPDRYQGTLRFKLEGSDDPVSVNVDLNVRDGPLWALLVIFAGIIVGRLAQGMETPEAKKQIKLLPRFYQLRADAAQVHDPDAVAYLTKQLQDMDARIESATETEEVLSQALDKLDARIGFLISLETLERELTESDLDALAAKLKPKIQDARQALLTENVEEAERLRSEVEKGLREAQRDGTMGAATDLFGKLLVAFRDSGTRLAAAEAAPAPERPGGARWGWLARLMAAISGARLISADVRYWLIRPLLWTVLLIGLALLGLQTLYVNAGSTFGAAGLYDYLGLFLWGISADVAQRTLQGLQLSK